MNDLEKIEKTVERLDFDFKSQLQALSSDTNDFHNALIELTSKYPEHKELLQFIVHINDRLETNQSLFSDIMVDTFNDIIIIKKSIISELIKIECKHPETTKPKSFWNKVLNQASWMKEIKLIATSLAIIALAIGVILAPDMFLEVIKALAALM